MATSLASLSSRVFWTTVALVVTVLALLKAAGAAEPVDLPKPFATPSVRHEAKVLGWADGQTPTAPPGLTVAKFGDEIENPRWLYVLPNGDVLVSQARTGKDGKSPNKITLLRDKDGDGVPELRETFAEKLNQPFGMAYANEKLFVANTDGVLVFPFEIGQTKLTGPGTKIVDLPAGGYNNHWTRNLLVKPGQNKLYISVGSGSNVAEHGIENEKHRACILEANLDGSELRVFADGLRNPVGMAWEPATQGLWTAVNERDELGDELVPDYITSVKEGAFYGWPYAYFGQNEDPRLKGQRPDLVKKSIAPDVPLGSHTASLGLAFYHGKAFPAKYTGGAFIGQRGSWNSSKLVGYRVAFVPFKEGKPAGKVEDFLTGFVKNNDEVYGRPVGVAVANDGALLVCDEPGNRIWRVSAAQ